MGLGGQEIIFLLYLLGFVFLLPLLALEVVRSEFRGPNNKLIWVVITRFLNLIGGLLYFFIDRNQRIV